MPENHFHPEHEPSEPTCLRSSRLAVEIAAPGIPLSRCRFDLNGFVTQVTLDGTHTFCVPESYLVGYGTQGIGICNEFTHPTPIGYDEARIGETFPKLGIGLLKRQDEGGFSVFAPQEVAAIFPVTLTSSADQARYVVEPLDCRGYAVREEKILRVHENQLTIHYQLENVGSRPVLLHEYVHNFIGIDHQPIGPDYVLSLPYPIRLNANTHFKEPDLVKIEGNMVGFTRTPKPALDFYCQPQGAVKTEQAQWELRNLASGAGMREFVDFAPHYVAVWGMEHVISAEIFVEVNLQPGEKQAWSRCFEFFD